MQASEQKPVILMLLTALALASPHSQADQGLVTGMQPGEIRLDGRAFLARPDEG